MYNLSCILHILNFNEFRKRTGSVDRRRQSGCKTGKHENVKIFRKNASHGSRKRPSFCPKEAEAPFFAIFVSQSFPMTYKVESPDEAEIMVRKEVFRDKNRRVLWADKTRLIFKLGVVSLQT